MKKPMFNKVNQVGLNVHDAVKVAKYYADELGIGPWKIYNVFDEGRDKPTFVLARGYVGGFEIELVQTNYPDNIHAEHLARHGQTLHHLQFWADDYDQCYRSMLDKGFKLLDSGELPGGIRFAYFDTTQEMGMITEIAVFPPGCEEAWVPDMIYPAEK